MIDRGRITKIMIDPGHGGKDDGARSRDGKYLEKEINLQIANKLFELIDLTDPFLGFYTRRSDLFIPLRERAEIANKVPVDFYLSIHINAHINQDPHGIQVYYFSDRNKPLAQIFLDELLKIYRNKDSRWNKIEFGNFAVLRYSNMPALLLELGFISNPKDLEWMLNHNNQMNIIDAILQALIKWDMKERGLDGHGG